MRKGVSVGISLLMLTLSVAVPLLEQSDFENEPVAESEHNPGECPTGHDHTICTQVGANLSIVAAHGEQHLDGRLLVVASPTHARGLAIATFDEGHPSRAPPVA